MQVFIDESPIYKGGNQLRSYQLEGLNWLSFCWHNRRNSVLADEMGLGIDLVVVDSYPFSNIALVNRQNGAISFHCELFERPSKDERPIPDCRSPIHHSPLEKRV